MNVLNTYGETIKTADSFSNDDMTVAELCHLMAEI
jgi:hypothetical protein